MKKLKDCCEIINGFPCKKEFYSIDKENYIPIIRIQNMNDNDKEYIYYTGDYDEKCIVEDNTILVSLSGTIKAYLWNKERALLNQRIVQIKPDKTINNKYLYYFLQAKTEVLKNKGKSAIINNVSVNDLKNMEIPDISLEEQEKIVRLLDNINNLIINRCDAKILLNELVDSKFLQMFGSEIQSGNKEQLMDLCEIITDGTHSTPEYADDGIIFLSSKDVTTKKIDWEHVKYIPESLHKELQKRVSPRINDILLAKNGTTGIAAIVDRDEVFDIYVSLALIRVKSCILPKFMLYQLNTSYCKKQFDKSLKGVGVPNLHLNKIRETKVINPPLELQKQFVDFVENIEEQEITNNKSIEELNNLFYGYLNMLFNKEEI